MASLALFDLDETLLSGDSDYEWGQFLVERGVLDRATYEARNKEFYDRYRAGTLDLTEFLEFQLKPLSWFSRDRLDAWHAEFMTAKVLPMIRPGARDMLDRHRDSERVIISATNAFVTGPIAALLGVPNLIATELETRLEAEYETERGRFTGRASGTPCFREGKVTKLEQWLASRGQRLADFDDSWFYSDSANDLPLLSLVTHPVAVHPDDRLRAHAHAAGWPILMP